MIRGYVEQPSPLPGTNATLRVVTDAVEFRAEFYRFGTDLELCHDTPWFAAQNGRDHLPFQDWGTWGTGLHGEALAPWPSYGFTVGRDWPPGVYLVVLIEGDGRGHDASDPDRSLVDGRSERALFVVRTPPADAGKILYKLPLLTYHAYNLGGSEVYDPATGHGHWCLYNMPQEGESPRRVPPAVSVHRPGGGTGATPYDIFNFDPFDSTPRQTFVHWDAAFIRWLHREGYIVDFCTDIDLHRDGGTLLAPYRLLVSAGHDEYWSDAMRDAVEQHVARGGNAAFFSGNTCWWRVQFHNDHAFSRIENWHQAGRPENLMTGVSFRNGGERDRDEHPRPVGYRVQHADHWLYHGTGLRDGDVFGEQCAVVGYECDGADFDRSYLDAACPVRPSGADGTPTDFTILGVGDVRHSGWGNGNGAATMGVLSRRGTVFTAATTDWTRALETSGEPVVEQITRNVMDRLTT